ncbi:mothers against decapentaplegic homolog 6 [Agrilus planipennis]|uniref:Mothers against decapentaplegic homolog n=1 Tax=Agrilus planipennis TaxID=224129 RepID=A0A1W4WBD3_AGRPL|nr:mothers against decapentaplegic homolog 6 [Agrilus planipennis]
MFMFRSKRTSYTKRLLKARLRRNVAGDDGANGGPESCLQELLKRLKDNQLEMLLMAIERRGQDLSNCVLLPRNGEPHVLCCQTWRWPELRQANELRRLPSCRSVSDPVYICCNPYHWSRLCQPESPPPPYSCFAMDRLKPEDRAPSEALLVCRDTFSGSVTTNGEDSSRNPREWCKLAYWELAKRVGPLFPVELPYVNVFWGDVPYADGLCLETLALSQHSFSPPPGSVAKTRCKIGLGVTLANEDDGVWMYNRSDHPVFVNSLTLEETEPTRVPAEHCLCIFDPAKAAHQNYGWNNFATCHGPVDRNSVRISFAKGWGRNYTRTEITSCPCWLEILLAPCR